MRDRLAGDLVRALKARDAVEVAALRSALAAIDNAGAVPSSAAASGAVSEHVAGAVAGLGSGEVPRRSLSDVEVRALLDSEVAERLSVADQLVGRGRQDRADELIAEAAVLRRYLS